MGKPGFGVFKGRMMDQWGKPLHLIFFKMSQLLGFGVQGKEKHISQNTIEKQLIYDSPNNASLL